MVIHMEQKKDNEMEAGFTNSMLQKFAWVVSYLLKNRKSGLVIPWVNPPPSSGYHKGLL